MGMGGEAMLVGDGRAFRAKGAEVGRRRRVVELEADRAKQARMELEDAGGAETPVDSPVADVVENPVSGEIAAAALGGRHGELHGICI